MLHPSYTDLMNAVNASQEDGEHPVIESRYSIVMAASKRARQLVDGDEAYVLESAKPLSTAVDEIYQQKVTIINKDND